MKKNIFLVAATPVLLLVTGCNKNASMENPSANTPAAQPQTKVDTNSPTRAEAASPNPAAGAVTDSANIETNHAATPDGATTTTNMSPP